MSGEPGFSLTDNPFAVLGVTPRVSPEQVEAADRGGRSAAAVRALLDPFERLTAELSWLPGVSNASAREIVRALEQRDMAAASKSLVLMRGLAKANLGADMAGRFNDADEVEDLVRAWEAVDPVDVANRVNEDRNMSGLPPVSQSQVGWGLEAVRARHAQTGARVLAGRSDGLAILGRLVARPVVSAEDARMVDALVEAWEEVTAEDRERLERAILAEVDAMTRTGRADAARLDGLLEAWARQHRPSLELGRLRRREDLCALRLVGDMRRIYLDPSPGPQRLAPAAAIAARVQTLFPDAPAIQRMAAGDLARLGSVRDTGYEETLQAPAATDSARGRREAEQAARAQRRMQRQATGGGKAGRTAVPTVVRQAPRQVTATPTPPAEATRDRLAELVRARVEAEGEAKQKKGGCGCLFPLLVGGFFLARFVWGEIEDRREAPPPPPPAVEAPGAVTPPPILSREAMPDGSAQIVAAEAQMAAALHAMVRAAEPGLPDETAPEPGEGALTLPEMTYCLFTDARLARTRAGPDRAEQLRWLERDHRRRCGGRQAPQGVAEEATRLLDANTARLARDADRISQVLGGAEAQPPR